MTALIAAVTLFAVFASALLIGYVKFDFKLVPYTGLFLATNLLSACVTEEAFFRGFLQERLTQFFAQALLLPIPGAYPLSALLFGVAHGHGGPVLCRAGRDCRCRLRLCLPGDASH